MVIMTQRFDSKFTLLIYKMDIWGIGCVMFEILTLVPLFPGKNELDMIHRIHNILGTPPQHVLDRFKR